MPDQVLYALCLLGAQYFLSIFGKAATLDWDNLNDAQVKVAFYAFLCAIWIYGLYRRQNWLRWITVLYTAFCVVALPLTLPRIADAAQLVLYGSELLLGITAAVLLCLPKALLWYQWIAVP